MVSGSCPVTPTYSHPPGISEALRQSFREAFLNEGHPSDGHIYRQIRLYDLQGNANAEGQWWARLRPNKRQDLKRLLNQKSRRRYAVALDTLLGLPGLWDGVRGGMWKKLMDLRCEEEFLHCLEHIRSFWSTMLQNDVQWMRRLNHITVKALGRKAPGASMTDLAFLYTKLQKGEMFYTFDFKYLRIWGQCAKTLAKVRPGETVFKALEQSFDDSSQKFDHCIVQAAPNDFTSVPGTITDRVDLGYRQLFLYIMRHHREMILRSTMMECRGRKKTAEGIHIPDEVDNLAWYRFAALAHQLGFTSMSITSLKSINKATTGVPSEQAKPSSVTIESGEAEERRSGRPYDLGYKQGQTSLFLNNFHSTDESQDCGITPFFVRRLIYLAFLGHFPFGGPTVASMPAT